MNVAFRQAFGDRRAIVTRLASANGIGKAAIHVMVLLDHLQDLTTIRLYLLFSVGCRLQATIQYVHCVDKMAALWGGKAHKAGIDQLFGVMHRHLQPIQRG